MADNWPIYLPNPGLPRSSLGSPCHKEHKSWNMNLLQIHHPATSHTLENRQFASMIYLSNLVIFHGYVKLSEGTHLTPTPRFVWSRAFWPFGSKTPNHNKPQRTTTDHSGPRPGSIHSRIRCLRCSALQQRPMSFHQQVIRGVESRPVFLNAVAQVHHDRLTQIVIQHERCTPNTSFKKVIIDI